MNSNGKIVNKKLAKSLSCTIKEYYITQSKLLQWSRQEIVLHLTGGGEIGKK